MELKKKFFSFCFAGASGAIVELVSFNLFFIFLAFMPSKILSLAIALTLNFILNRNFTFKAYSERKRKQFSRYLAVYAVAIVVNLSVSLLMNNILGNGAINANIATATGIVAAIPITFFGSLHWVFKDKIPKN
jgi:putative flippase GtrA